MAASGYTPIQIYHSTTASAAPTAGNLVNGELAINILDGKLYYKDNGGVVQVIATKGTGTIGGSTTQVQYNNTGALAGSANFTFDGTTATINTLNLTNALGAAYGGTAQSTYAQGDLLYASAANTLAKLPIGISTYILTSNGSIPGWSIPSSVVIGTATNLAGGAAGSVPYQSGAGTTTFLTIGTANQVVTSTGSAPQWSSALTLTGLSNSGLTTLDKTVTVGNTSFNGAAVFAPATPAKVYLGTGTVTDVTSAIAATNAAGAIVALGVTPIAATNANVTYTNASTLYIAGAPSAGTNITITNPYALYVAAGNAYFGASVSATTLDLTNLEVTNIKAKDGTASMTLADSTGVVTFSKATVIEATDNTNAALRITQLGTGNAILVEDSANPDSTPFVVTAAGDVGIGTSSPGAKLDIVTSSTIAGVRVNNATAGKSAMVIQNNGSNVGIIGLTGYWNGNSETNFGLYAETGSDIRFSTNGVAAPKAIIDTSGNLGIGTDTPVSALGFGQAASATGITFQSTSTTFNSGKAAVIKASISGSGNGALIFETYEGGSGGGERMRLTNTGTLNIVGAGTAGSTQAISFNGSTPVDTLVTDSSGRVGIGTSSPGAKLHTQQTSAGSRVTGALLQNVGDSASTAVSLDFAPHENTSSPSILARINAERTAQSNAPTDLVFSTFNSTLQERARITSGGQFAMTNDGTNAAPAISFTNDLDTGIFRPTTNQLGFATAGVQAMTLDASGKLLVGTTTSPNQQTVIYRTSATTSYGALLLDGNGNYAGIQFAESGNLRASLAVDNSALYLTHESVLAFKTGSTANVGGTERARITSGGYFKASNNGTYLGSTGTYHEFYSTTDDEYVLRLRSTGSTLPYGIYINYSGASPNSTTSYFLDCGDSTAARAQIRSNGGLANYSANDVNLSDRREKTNFAPAKSYLDTICAIPVQTFNYIDQSEDDPGLTLGVVAQDVQAVAPELVMESNWGTKDDPKMRLSIYQTDLQYALMKCIQELKSELDSVKAELATLKGA